MLCNKMVELTFTASLVSMVSGVATDEPWCGGSILGRLGRSAAPADCVTGVTVVAPLGWMACSPE